MIENCKLAHTCPDCGMPMDEEIPQEQLINPCPMCGASLKDGETGECVFCRRV